MTTGKIDSASLYDVVLALRRAKARDSYSWEWKQSLIVTAMLIRADHTELALPKTALIPPSGPFGAVTHHLGPILSKYRPRTDDANLAIRRTKAWASRNPSKLRRSLASLDQPIKQGGNERYWLETHVEGEWLDHSMRYHGLFDPEYVGVIAKTLDLSQTEILGALKKSRDIAFIKGLLDRRLGNDDFKLLRDAYMISTLLRGRYYESLAEIAGQQILSHPIRRPVRKRTPTATQIPIDVSKSELFLSNIVLANAFSESKHVDRAARWASDVLKLREARAELKLNPDTSDDNALNAAIETAKRFDITPKHRKIEATVDATLNFGLIGGGLFLNSPEAIVLGLGSYFVTRKKSLGAWVMRAFPSRRGTLRRLAQMGPGRLDDGPEISDPSNALENHP